MMHRGGQAERLDHLAQERGLLALALDQMHGGAWLTGEHASENEPGEAAAGADVEPSPGARREIDELERVRDMAGPDLADRGGADQVRMALRREEELDEAIEQGSCFT